MTLNYQPWDREEKLGPPPWKHDDPRVVAWEEAHGHDVRLKCYPEFGCQLADIALFAAVKTLLDGAQRERHNLSSVRTADVDALRVALEGKR